MPFFISCSGKLEIKSVLDQYNYKFDFVFAYRMT
jgi:hypothetical protein